MPNGTSLRPMGTRRTDAVRIATGRGIVEIPWESSQELRGRVGCRNSVRSLRNLRFTGGIEFSDRASG
jgi:hypothetical protein